MNYFITSRQDMLTSAIEFAQVKRLKVFDSLHQPATLVTLQYNFAHREVEKKLGISGRVINLYQYFQRLPYHVFDHRADQQLVHRALHQAGYEVRKSEHAAYLNGVKRVQIMYDGDRLRNINYFDHYGFSARRDYYDCACLTYSEFFEDKGRIVTRQYYDHTGRPKITEYYRGGEDNKPILTLIRLFDRGNEYAFDDKDQLRAYFLDQLVEDDPQASFISDRSDYTLAAFKLMKYVIPRYQVFHSAFTVDGQPKSDLFPIYKQLKEMLEKNYLTGLISATKREAADAANRFATQKSYGIPVTYLDRSLLTKKIPFGRRIPGQLIAVARLTAVKRLDQLIETVILLHQKYPAVDLKIYGFDDSWNNYATSNHLKKIVKNKNAQDYVHFCGFYHDLTKVYETADIEVLTSSYEGFAMALLEAQGHACPAVSYDINYGPAEIIADNKSGRLLPSGDTSSLYRTLESLLTDRDKLARYSANAQAAAAKFSFANIRKAWQQFLQQENLWQD